MCRGCGGCKSCPITDDLKKFPMDGTPDAYLFVAPIYMGHIPGVLKNFLDRIDDFISSFKIKDKVINLILVGKWPIKNERGRIYSNEEPIENINAFFDYYAAIGECRFNYVDFFQSKNIPATTFVYDEKEYAEKLDSAIAKIKF